MIRVLGELLMLIRWIISTNKTEEFRDDVEEVKANPSGRWAKLFGRVQSDSTDSRSDSRFNDNTEGMSTGCPKTTKR